jgi:hypothetical protein
LRSKAYGHKKDYYEKDHIHYPLDNKGVVDEWSALVQTMHEKHLNDMKIEKERKIQTQKEYWEELERTRLIKEA